MLQKFTSEDIPKYLDEINKNDSKFLLQLAGPAYKYPLTIQQLKRELNDENHLHFKYINKDSVIGYCQLTRIDWETKTASIGRVLITNNFRGKGFSTSMIAHLIIHSKDQLNLTKLSLRVFDFNTSAIKCYENMGFIEISKEKKFYSEINESWVCITMEKKI